MFKNKVITVFGGSGSIGSLIVEELLKYEPESIRVFTNDEDQLVQAQRRWNYPCMRFLLGDIRNKKRCKLATQNADFVINAAAIKHVPVCEYNIMEAIYVNILGLNNILEACIHNKVKKVLHISTDKVTEATTIMGMTKKIGEEIVQRTWYQNPFVNMVVVRLGNVWGSRGSIVPLVKEQIQQQKSITITDEEMQRFFMQPEEVRDFIMKAFIEGKDGEIWVPKLKERKLIDVIYEITGKKYPIEIIGVRKGEKLREKMLADDEVLRANHQNRGYWIIPASE